MSHRLLSRPAEAADQIAALFDRTFTASEGPDEGRVVASLAEAILRITPNPDLRAFVTEDGGAMVAAAVFTRLTYADDQRTVFLLSPMAVAPDRQRQGLGQALLTHALETLRGEGVQVAVTYGNPAYYHRVGFRPVTPAEAAPPLPLSMSQGWIAQSLDGQPLRPLTGPSTCVPALNRRDVW